jgi:hypothetical protein
MMKNVLLFGGIRLRADQNSKSRRPPGATSRSIFRFPEQAVQVEQFAGYLAKGPGTKALGITVPPSLLATADALIE